MQADSSDASAYTRIPGTASFFSAYWPFQLAELKIIT
jgi:hypothetical protein